jgi:hypothetical protein
MKTNEIEKNEALKQLRKIIKPNDVINCFLRHVASSGMSRRISFFVIKNNKLIGLDWYIEKVLGYKRSYNNLGLVVGGCGMDMGFAVVYALGLSLWPKGTKKPHGIRNGEPDSHGGYALKHSWV